MKYTGIILVFLLVPIGVWAINTIVTGFKTTTTKVEIDAHGTCRDVRHTGSTSYFVPTKTSSEWSSFRSNIPNDVSVTTCIYHWYWANFEGCSTPECTSAQNALPVCPFAGTYPADGTVVCSPKGEKCKKGYASGYEGGGLNIYTCL